MLSLGKMGHGLPRRRSRHALGGVRRNTITAANIEQMLTRDIANQFKDCGPICTCVARPRRGHLSKVHVPAAELRSSRPVSSDGTSIVRIAGVSSFVTA